MRDISSKKILEREFSMNEQLFKDLFDRAVDGIVLFDKDGGFIDANLSFCKSFEINHNELSHLSLYEFIDSGSRKDFDNIWKTLNRKGKAKGSCLSSFVQEFKNYLNSRLHQTSSAVFICPL